MLHCKLYLENVRMRCIVPSDAKGTMRSLTEHSGEKH
jgi:hypothetical protein